MHFEWDEVKRQANIVKHGIDFDVAPIVFAGDLVTIVDTRKDYGEIRYISLGDLRGRTIVIAHTQRRDTIRIISMRKANERERKIYRTHLGAAGRDEG